ncbi:hypothetical protein [Chitinophaga sp. Cy-1792]|uniref:hypothetical protein n=1 Tax=Chitinophaga sp. Cy-1792 TaxID=2608339 RepID=UPI00141EB779|nr:hypothetical protein [Chitinophaga sp. Cy-1792]NIG56816.1 hypothetical protein [Chitinophaga sp. Cy-1792]
MLIFVLGFTALYGQANQQKERNITAFAKVFGYVRYFYPSDEAANADWERFSIYDVRRIGIQPDDKALVKELNNLLWPSFPALEIYSGDERPTAARE